MAKHASGFLRLVNDAKSRITECTIADVKPRLDAGEKFFLVDVREDREFAAGHLPGAAHLGRGILERDIEQAIPDTTAEIVLYCGGGYRSTVGCSVLERAGFKDIANVTGGMGAWRAAGLPTTRADVEVVR